MAEDIRTIDDPEALKCLMAEWQARRSGAAEAKERIRLSILAPLHRRDMLDACYDEEGCYTRLDDGKRGGRLSDTRVINLTALSDAWRSVCKSIPVEAVEEIIFDARLPAGALGDVPPDSHGLHWPSEGSGIIVLTQEFIRLVIAVATVMSIRSRKTVRFSFANVPDPEPRARSLKRLSPFERVQKHFELLSSNNPTQQHRSAHSQ